MTAIEIGLAAVAALLALGLGLLGLLRLEMWLTARRERNARADAAIEALLRDRFEGARRAREIHGLTVPELLDLVDIEIDLEADGDLRSRVDDLNTRFPNP